MKRAVLSTILVACAAAGAMAVGFSPSAKADILDFTFTGSVYGVTGEAQTDGSNMLVALTGNVAGPGGGAITGITPLTPPGDDLTDHTYDQLLMSADPFVTNNGIDFMVGGNFYNIYSVVDLSATGGFDYFVSTVFPNAPGAQGGPNFNPGDQGSLGVSPVPGPIVGAGLPGLIVLGGGLIALNRRRRHQRDGHLPAYA